MRYVRPFISNKVAIYIASPLSWSKEACVWIYLKYCCFRCTRVNSAFAGKGRAVVVKSNPPRRAPPAVMPLNNSARETASSWLDAFIDMVRQLFCNNVQEPKYKTRYVKIAWRIEDKSAQCLVCLEDFLPGQAAQTLLRHPSRGSLLPEYAACYVWSVYMFVVLANALGEMKCVQTGCSFLPV